MLRAMLLVLFMFGCAEKKTTIYKPDPGGDGGGDSALEEKYNEIKSTLTSSCETAGCHAGGAIADLSTASKFKNGNSKARIENGTMPPGGNISEADKEKLLSFF